MHKASEPALTGWSDGVSRPAFYLLLSSEEARIADLFARRNEQEISELREQNESMRGKLRAAKAAAA